MSTSNRTAFLAALIEFERARLREIEYAIETKQYDLTTLHRIAAEAREEITRTEAYYRKLTEGTDAK